MRAFKVPAADGSQLGCWNYAPKERTPTYFRTYAAVAKTMQNAMRAWVREWFATHPEVLNAPDVAYPILFYISTDPCRAKPTNYFTYDVQETEMMEQAFQSVRKNLGGLLLALPTEHLAWNIRERYFPYRSSEIAKYTAENCRSQLYCMFHVETMLMDKVLKFVLINIPKLGFDEAWAVLRSTVQAELKRFSTELDLSTRTEELLRLATQSLSEALPKSTVGPSGARVGHSSA